MVVRHEFKSNTSVRVPKARKETPSFRGKDKRCIKRALRAYQPYTKEPREDAEL